MSVYSGPADWWTDKTNDGKTHMATKGIIQDGLVFNLDAGVSTSYPGSGSTFSDIKNSLNVTLYGAVTYSSTDNYGGLIFNGTNQYGSIASVPLASPISVTNNFTIEQVFKPTGYAASTYYGLANMLLQKGPAAYYNYATQVTTSTSVSFIKRTINLEGLQSHTFTVPDMTNKVCFLSFVIENGSNTSIDTVTCYMNGNFIGSLLIYGSAIGAVDNEPLYLCGLASTQYTMFTGSYYCGRIYNRALSATEISKNYNALRGRFGV